jgi:hypothetical protein
MITLRRKITIAAIFVLVLGSFALADALLQGSRLQGLLTENATEQAAPTADAPVMETSPTELPTEGAPAPVAKAQGIDVIIALNARGYTVTDSSESALIAQTTDVPVMVHPILSSGDRIGSVAWIDTPKVKQLMNTLKDALLPTFSPALTDLRDETLAEPGSPVRNVLSFRDPGISSDRIVIVRVRERLYEFHVTNDDVLLPVIEELTKH